MAIVSRTLFQTNTDTLYPDNTSGQISPADLRAQMDDIADSAAFRSVGYSAAPTANDDDAGTGGNGEFNVGDIWIDETNNNAYICMDDTATSAIWEFIGGALTITSQTGTAVSGQIATWASNTEIRGDAELTWDGSNILAVASASPILELQDTDGAADNQRWLTWVDTGIFKIQAFTDAGTGGDDYIQMPRTGNVVNSLDFVSSGAVATSVAANALDFTGGPSTIQTTDSNTLTLGTNGTDRVSFAAGTFVTTFAGDGAALAGVQVGNSNLTTGNSELHLGVGRTGDGISRIEFVTDTTYTTSGLRVERGAGENAVSQITHRGTGRLALETTEAADIVLSTNANGGLTVDGTTQDVTLTGDLIVSSATPLIRMEDTDAAADGYGTITIDDAAGIIISADPTDVEANSYIGFDVDGVAAMSLLNNATTVTTDGPLLLGIDDTQWGRLYLYGDGTGSTQGAAIRLHTAADHDTTNEYYQLRVQSENFAIELADGTDLIGYYPATETVDMGVPSRDLVTTVASLPAAATVGAGARAFVTDANATTFASVVAAGGANGVPVYSDGTDWRIG